MEEQPQLSVAWAFIIDLAATFLSQIAYLVIKFAHIDADKTQKSAVFSCKFLTGLVSLIISGVIHIVMMPFCPLILLAMNSATAILMSATLSILILGERLVWQYDLVAFILISSGCTAIFLLTKESEAQLTSEVIAGQLKSLQAIIFAIIYIIVTVLNYLLVRWFIA